MTDSALHHESSLFESEFALSELFDFNIDAKLKKKYIILSSPRTGSTMLASALYNSGVAGAPFEYFHKNLLALRNNPERRPNELNQYLEEMIARRTSPNGYFGMKLHFGQFEYLFGANPVATEIGVKFISEFDKHILIYRRDKILQAVSALLASEAKIWSRTSLERDQLLGRSIEPDDVVGISSALNAYVKSDQAWRKVLKSANVKFMDVAYEDLCDRPEQEMKRVYDYLEIEMPSEIPAHFPTEKLTNIELTNELKQRFLEEIGA